MYGRIAQTAGTPGARYASVGLAALAVSVWTLGAGFVLWDDGLLTGRLAVRGLSWEHLRAMLVPSGGSYQPVRDLTFALTHAFSGASPRGYHLVNMVLYLVNALLAYRVLEVLVRRGAPGAAHGALAAWIGALVFALHPLHVEVFAWVQGNKDLLAGAFFLAAFLGYEKSSRSRGVEALRHYLLAYVAFLLALASKPSAAAFPLVILSFDLLFRKKEARADIRGLIARHAPYWVPAGLLAVYFIFFTGALRHAPLSVENFLVLPRILADSLRLALFPLGLLHRYPDPVFSGFASLSFWAGLSVTAAALWFVFRHGRRHPLPAFGILWFYLCWLPQSNLVPIAIRVADRYLFLSILGLGLVAGLLLAGPIVSSRGRFAGKAAWAATALILLSLGTLSIKRTGAWQDGLSLWGGAMESLPYSDFFRRGLAEVYIERGELDSAFGEYEKALALNPGEPISLVNMGYIRRVQGRDEEALELYGRVLEMDRASFNALNSVGNIHAARGEDSLAVEFYHRALGVRPDNYMVRLNLATLYRRRGDNAAADSLMGLLEGRSLPEPVVLLRRGRQLVEEGKPDSARARFERALELDRELHAARTHIGEILLRQDSLEQALRYLRPVFVSTVPDWSLLNNLGLAWDRLGQPDSALVYYRRAWTLAPDSVSSGLSYAVNLNRADSTERAIEVALGLAAKRPEDPLLHYNLGNWLVTRGRYNEAIGHYRRVLVLDPGNDKAHLNLALVYMQFVPRPDSALTHFEKSLEIAPDQPQAAAIRNAISHLVEHGAADNRN